MTLNLYSVKDVKVGFMKPFTAVNGSVAQRDFSMAVNRPGDDFMAANFGDLELWYLGSFDDQTGVVVGDLEYICKGCDVRKVEL